MRDHMNCLTEGLDTVAQWRWTRRSKIEWEAEFKIGTTVYETSIFNEGSGVWVLNFSARKAGEQWGSAEARGTGNGRAVYATVIDIFSKFEDEMTPVIRGFKIESDTTERSRHRVNQHVARLLQQRFQGEYEIEDDAANGKILMMRTDEDDQDDDLDESALFERRRAPPVPEPFNPKQIDPALLTFAEYEAIANEKGKFHPDEAYATSLAEFAQASYFAKKLFPHLIKRVKINGLFFEFRVRTEKRVYVKYTPQGTPERDEAGNSLNMSDAEIAAAGLLPHSFYIGVYDEDGRTCGGAQDEWGCILIRIANEYKGFGLGLILSKMARTFEPGKTSGGFSAAGHRTFVKMHRESVRDALTTGRYNAMVRSGALTTGRVKEIIASARLERKSAPPKLDLSNNDPRDWLLYADPEFCAFVLYDKKLREVVADGGDDVWMWGEGMVKGYVLVREIDGRGITFRFGADTPALKKFMLLLAASWCAREGIPFFVDDEDASDIDPRRMSLAPSSKRTGISRREATLIQDPIEFAGMVRAEKAFRNGFDRYGEFHDWVLTLADQKFRPNEADGQ